jgi:hypothetical protein
MFRLGLLASVFVALGSSSLNGQTYLVDSLGGPGSDFSDLQVALDTVPDDSTLLIQGWFDGYGVGSFKITKTVTMIGLPYPGGASYPSIRSGIVIDAAGADVLITDFWSSDSNSGIYGSYDTPDNGVPDAIQVVAARSVIIQNSGLFGGATLPSPIVYGAGVRVVGSIDFVELTGSTAAGWQEGYYGPDILTLVEGGPWSAPNDGAPGLDLPPALVGLAAIDNCTITGGGGMYLQYLCDDSIDVPPGGPLVAGNGGPALHGNAEATSSVFAGGPGGIFVPDSPDDCSNGTGQDGQPGLDVDGIVTDRAFGGVQLRLVTGQTCWIAAPAKQPLDVVLVFLAADWSGPFHLNKINGELQVLPPWELLIALADSSRYAVFTFDVPNDPTLVGLKVYAQSYSSGALSMLGACRVLAN